MIEVIKNIDEVYSVSNLGRFYRNGVEMKGSISTGGYVQVSMYGKVYYLHRLVALAFPEICGEWFEGAQVDHINTTKTDNKAENLRFVSCSTNNNNPLTKKHMSEALKGRKPIWSMKPVLQYTKEEIFIREWESVSEVERVLGYNQGNICKCCLNKKKSAYNYIWKYKEAV